MDSISDYHLIRNVIIQFAALMPITGGTGSLGWFTSLEVKQHLNTLSEYQIYSDCPKDRKLVDQILEELTELNILETDGISNYRSWRFMV